MAKVIRAGHGKAPRSQVVSDVVSSSTAHELVRKLKSVQHASQPVEVALPSGKVRFSSLKPPSTR